MFRRATSAGETGTSGAGFPIPTPGPAPISTGEQFLGDSPQVEFTPSRFFRWRLYWDYGGGPATDLLVHAFTPVMRLLDLGFPQRVMGGGGSFQYGLEIPDQCNILADYPGGPSVVLMNSLSNYSGIETILRGTDGLVKMSDIEHLDRVDAGAKQQRPGIRIVPTGKDAKEILIPWDETNADKLTVRLFANFFDCVRSRQPALQPRRHGLAGTRPLVHGRHVLPRRQGDEVRRPKDGHRASVAGSVVRETVQEAN